VLLIFSALVGIHIYFIYAVYSQSPSTFNLYTCFRETPQKHAPCHLRGRNSTAEFLKLRACQQTTERFETLLWRHERPSCLLFSYTGAVVHRGYANIGSCKRPGRSARTHAHHTTPTIWQ